ncbi:MAG: Rid family detoxifying hydrolase [Gammaproteobacteria bacterium]
MQPIHSAEAPAALGPYSQAIRVDRLVFLSGQIGLDPEHQTLVTGGVEAEARQVFRNLAAVAAAAGASLQQTVKLTLYLTDLGAFPRVNAIMADVFSEPFPARATVGVAALPRGAAIEADAILMLDGDEGG